MARITGYGQSGRIEWDRPVESCFADWQESTKAYMDRMLADATTKEIEITKKRLEQSENKWFLVHQDPLGKSILTSAAVAYLINRERLFDINSIFLAIEIDRKLR